MALLNYTTTIDASRTVAEIQNILVRHGARQLFINYSQNGEVEALSFIVLTPQGNVAIKLPVNPDAVLIVLKRQHARGYFDRPRAVKIAWRIVKDWVEAQMALLETEMVKLEQIFLPYVMVNEKQTLFQAFTEGKLLTQGKIDNDQDGEFHEIVK